MMADMNITDKSLLNMSLEKMKLMLKNNNKVGEVGGVFNTLRMGGVGGMFNTFRVGGVEVWL